ncbi:superoxide dismutase, Cu-Zn family [Pelagirhabdus alkalitolerans]|uniref:Superoxide dismutase [Cu-Zn] n=1 Tax=Pelagirhabdus alkalitolerans TaxID=1612202 RepID=A0A1G6GMZ3_9BACI|nr:superoxide dismutase family protein [Pelagirhabdus alkalitolerans]SDB83318.1 superoxide dismutase, Cu-Zn family [Pelagirhabdus alkalitolerans]
MKRVGQSLLTIMIIISLSACAEQDQQDTRSGDDQLDESIEVSAHDLKEVEVTLMNTEGNPVANATLTEKEEGGVNIIFEGQDLPPGELGFHIHDVGECIPPNFESAGGHYNPTDSKHGFNHPEGPHAGDLENIHVNEDGTVYAEVEAPMVSLKRDHENTLFTEEGTSLVIHSGPDDYFSQPAGDAGDRIACGVIGE